MRLSNRTHGSLTGLLLTDMRVFLLFHDAALPHSRYLLEGFAAHSRVSQLTVVYPEGRGADIIFSAGSSAVEDPAAYQIVGLPSSRLRPKWVQFRALRDAMQKARPDYVVVLDEALYPNTFAAGLAARWLGFNVPVVFYGFENINQTPPWDWLRTDGLAVLASVLRKAVRYYLFDRGLQFLRKKLVSGGLVSYPECAEVIHQTGWRVPMREQWWGVDTGLFRRASEAKAGRPAEWAVVPNTKVIGFVGRFVPEKGVNDLLQALVALGSEYTLVCIGGGPQEADLRQAAVALGVDSQLRILPPMPAVTLAKHIAVMDVLALPSRTERFWKEQYGRVLVEAMAAGVPVVGADSGAISYVIGDPQRVFAEGDIAGICNAVNTAVAISPEARVALQERARRGDISTFVQGYVDLYDQLC